MRGHETLRSPVVERDSRCAMCDNGATNKDGPGTALTVFSGASPINHLKESDRLMPSIVPQPTDAQVDPAPNRCPRRQCRGRLPHSLLVHWLGWVRR